MTDTANYLQVGEHLFDYIYNCRCCGKETLTPFLDLGKQPLANSFHKQDETLQNYPLKVNVCATCWHSQLSIVVNPEHLFKNYIYVSGTTDTLRDYFDWFAMWSYMTWNKITGQNACRVLDIASNDGTQLDAYKVLGCETYGVDPAENLAPIAVAKGHTIDIAYWSEQASFFHAPRSFDIIVAQNVFAHVNNIMDFLMGCKRVLSLNGLLFIQTSQADMFKNGEFDTIYHEHLSFFSVNSMKTICERVGLVLNRVDQTNIHGKSYVFTIGMAQHLPSNIQEHLDKEKAEGRENLKTYQDFGVNALKTVDNLAKAVQAYRIGGRKVVGFGAAAKGMTLLNAGGIDLEYIVDENPRKQGLLSPGMDIPIVSPDVLAGDPEKSLIIVPLAWNFADEIYDKAHTLRPKASDTFLEYFPKLRVYQ